MSYRIFEIELLPGEFWWGGAVQHGIMMPFGQKPYEFDLGINIAGNQANPIFISNKGRYIWCEKPLRISFNQGILKCEAKEGTIDYGEGYENLKNVYKFVSSKYFPASGKAPDIEIFKVPQYNTWIEMMYEPTQEKTIKYAKSILENNMPSGILIIDDNWQEDYGKWEFHEGRFPDPKSMVDTLHDMGFKVMLWIAPFISPDSFTFRELEKKGYLLKNSKGQTAIRHWWNGYSGILDCTNKDAVDWLYERLDNLMHEYGIDGFKLDGGDPEYYEDDDLSSISLNRNDHCKAWAEVGLKYELNEYRACWKLAGKPIVQRLSDKAHSWYENGLASLIPNGLSQGILGYTFNCPDLIGGGEYTSFLGDTFSVDQDLFVRYAQCSALFPIMQFSAAPWRVLDDEHLKYCIDAANLHKSMGDYIEKLVLNSAQTGEPIMRHMAYEFPDEGFELINDQFMLGEYILVAPVVKKGATKRKIVFPKGKWLGDDKSVILGPAAIEVQAPLSRLPWYRKKE